MQLTHHTQHPVRFRHPHRTDFYATVTTVKSIQSKRTPQKVTIHIVTDQTENELAHQIKSSGATEIRTIPNGKVRIYTPWRCIRHFTEYKTTNRLQTLPEQKRASTLLPTRKHCICIRKKRTLADLSIHLD